MKKTLIINGHPNKDSLCSSLSQSYVKKAAARGDSVDSINVSELKFNPNLVLRSDADLPVEDDLKDAQRKIAGADHIVWIYPNWWGGPPALLKAFIDRTLHSGFAFKYKKGSGFPEKLLKGKTSEIILTLDTPPWMYKWLMGAPGIKVMKNAILGFCGIKLVRNRLVGPVRGSTEEQRKNWIDSIL